VHAAWRRDDAASLEQYLQRLRSRHAGTDLAGHCRRRATLCAQVDERRIDEIPSMQCRGCQAEQEPQRLLVLAAPVETEIFGKRHPSRNEIQQRGTHAERRHGRRGNAQRRAAREHEFTRFECEEVESVDEEVGALQEPVDVVCRDAVGKDRDFHLRIDVPRHRAHDIELRTADRTLRRADLPVEVHELEPVELGEAEPAHAESGERQEVRAAHAAEAGDRNALVAQRALLVARHPAQIARECAVVVERGGHYVAGIGRFDVETTAPARMRRIAADCMQSCAFSRALIARMRALNVRMSSPRNVHQPILCGQPVSAIIGV